LAQQEALSVAVLDNLLGSPAEVRVFTPGMRPVGSVYPVRDVQASWSLREDGAATFTIPKNSLRWSDSYVGIMNRVEIHDDRVPEPWCGVIMEQAPSDAEVQLTCVGARWLLSTRITDRYVAGLGTETAGQVVHMLFEQAVRRESLGVALGALDLSGPSYYVEYEWKGVAQGLDELAQITGGHWWVEKGQGEYRDPFGTLRQLQRLHRTPWLVRWARSRGVDRSGDVLLSAEVTNLPDFRRTGQGMANFAHVLGVEVAGERLYVPVPDTSSIRAFGLIETKLEFPEIADPTLLEEAGKRELFRKSRPIRSLALNVDNRRDMWGRFWLGDLVRVVLTNVDFLGLDLLVRVLGIQLNAATGAMGLVVELA
jgi:hypothetical protein